MGKTPDSSSNKDYCTNIIYKKSNSSIKSVSRTQFGSGCSGYLQKSTIRLQCSKISQNTNYYVGGGKTKRDMSVETRYAMSRRLLLERRKRMHDKDEKKHRYPDDNGTANCTITQTSIFRSGCGDSNPNSIESLSRSRNTDMDAVMIDNLKILLSKLIDKHFDNEKAQNKIDKALHRMFHSDCAQKELSPFIKSQEDGNNEKSVFKDKPITCQYCKHMLPKFGSKLKKINSNTSENLQRCSGHTHPFPFKNVHIVSTLSVPRKNYENKSRGIDKYCKRHSHFSCYRMRKGCNKHIFLSINKSKNTIILDSSNVDILAVTAEPSSRKRCSNIIKPKQKQNDTKHGTPKSNKSNFLKTTTKNVPSLMDNIFVGTTADITGKALENIKTEICTNTEPIEECQVIAANLRLNKNLKANPKQVKEKLKRKEKHRKKDKVQDFIDETVNLNTPKMSPKTWRPRKRFFTTLKTKRIDNINSSLTKAKYKMNRNSPKRTQIMTTSFERVQFNNKFSYLYKKVKDREMNTDHFLKQLQEIFEYFANYDTDKDIKLDVRIKVYPTIGDGEDKGFKISNTVTKIMTAQEKNNLSFSFKPNANSSKHSKLDNKNKFQKSDTDVPHIISLLDGAASQERYIHTNNNTIDSSFKSNIEIKSSPLSPENQTLVHNADILHEIGEVKAIITGLANIAEKYIKENLHNEVKKKRVKEKKAVVKKSIHSSNTNVDDSKQYISKKECASKTENEKENQQAAKTKKRRLEEIMAQESISYNIIDSECLVRVTDMTSAANANKNKPVYKEPKDLSTKNTRSFVETTEMTRGKGNNRKRSEVINVYTHKNFKCKSSEISALKAKRQKTAYVTKGGSSFNNVDIKRTQPIKPKKQMQAINANEKQAYNCNNFPNFSCYPPQPYPSELDCENCCKTSSTIVIDIEEKPPQGISVRNRNVTFWPGLIYCILIWVPAIIVLILFFKHVIVPALFGNKGGTKSGSPGRMGAAASRYRMPFTVDISMSELGF